MILHASPSLTIVVLKLVALDFIPYGKFSNWTGNLENSDLNQVDRMLNINFKAAFSITQRLLYKFKLQKYSFKNLHKESDLFFDWYLKFSSKNLKIGKIKRILKIELNKIYKKLYFKNNTFVHRDFHASNIMVNKKAFGLVDSQDAIIGNPLYDVASLIDDVRIKLPNNLQNKLLKFYYSKSKFKR